MNNLLYAIAFILIVMWIVGLTRYDSGGLIHILLVLAVIAVLFRIISGKKI